ncbi:MAG: NlpC/P60 family protein [Gaiellaceae bacterium]
MALVAVLPAAPAARVEAAGTPPAIRAKQAQALAVVRQINTIDTQLGRAMEQWNGARFELAQVRTRLAQTRADLAQARRQHRLALTRVARRLVQLYTSPAPSSLDVIVGAVSLSAAIDAADTADALAGQDHTLAVQTAAARDRLARAERTLAAERARRTAAVAALAQKRSQIEAQLAQRQRLLASVRSEIRLLKAREAAHQRELAAAARARLAQQEAALRAARLAAQHEAAQRATAEQGQALEQQTPAPPAAPSDPTATTTQGQPSAQAPAPSGGGHPEAAAIALRYLGVPYVWGGASPSGFDCSGLVMYVYAQLGISLPHYAAAQYGYGTPVTRDQLLPGDLVFFDGLGHVGIYIGNGEIVHAPHTGDVVKISPLSEFGAGYVGARRL